MQFEDQIIGKFEDAFIVPEFFVMWLTFILTSQELRILSHLILTTQLTMNNDQ